MSVEPYHTKDIIDLEGALVSREVTYSARLPHYPHDIVLSCTEVMDSEKNGLVTKKLLFKSMAKDISGAWKTTDCGETWTKGTRTFKAVGATGAGLVRAMVLRYVVPAAWGIVTSGGTSSAKG